ncbi:hypothetical protein Tco_0971099 [Tanacetum coccineum]
MVFEGMVKHLDSRSKFLMYPMFIQILLNKHQRLLLLHKRTYVAPTLTQKLFSNMRRVSEGYTEVNIPLFSNMLAQGPIQQGEGSTLLDFEIEKEVMKRPGFNFQQKSSKKRSREDSDEDNAKKQKLKDDSKKKELRDSMDVVLRDDIAIDVESLATKYYRLIGRDTVLTEN